MSCSESSCGSIRGLARAGGPTRSRRQTPSSGRPVRGRRSGLTACAIPGASRSIERRATSRSPTLGRTPGRRSTSFLRAQALAAAPTSAGSASRGGTSPATTRRTAVPALPTTRRPCTSTDTPAASRSRAVTWCATPTLPALAGRYVYGDALSTPLWSAVLQTPTAADDRQLGLNVGDLYSFGEDACGRVYAASGGGSVQRLKASGSPSAPTCTPSALPPPPPPPGPPAPPPTTAKRKICRVPKLKGLRGVTARARIRRANCRVGRVRSKHAARRRGRVISQAPRPGARRVRGTRVHFTVSRGRR